MCPEGKAFIRIAVGVSSSMAGHSSNCGDHIRHIPVSKIMKNLWSITSSWQEHPLFSGRAHHSRRGITERAWRDGISGGTLQMLDHTDRYPWSLRSVYERFSIATQEDHFELWSGDRPIRASCGSCPSDGAGPTCIQRRRGVCDEKDWKHTDRIGGLSALATKEVIILSVHRSQKTAHILCRVILDFLWFDITNVNVVGR